MYLTKSGIVILLLSFMSCSGFKKEGPKKIATHKTKPLIEIHEIPNLIQTTNYVFVDFRPKHLFEQGHVPNAVQIWRSDIENKDHSFSGMMASKIQLEQLFSGKGIKNSDTLIIYDDRGSCEAARLWWVLASYGFEQTRILNGGFDSYVKSDNPLSIQTLERPKSQFSFNEMAPNYYISIAELKQLMENGEKLIVLDTRSSEEYSGLRQKDGAAKAGRIPNSISIQWNKAMDSNESNKFLSHEELEKLFARIAPNKEESVVVYCHSGVRSAHTTFVLTQLLDYKNVKNYDGSWTEWSHHELPYEKDVETTILE